MFGIRTPLTGFNLSGLLGPMMQQQGGGLLGGQYPMNTQALMNAYLQNLFMRRYNPPSIPQQPGMVSSSLGMGGRQYQAPQIANVPLPGAQSQNAAPQGSTPYPQGGGYFLNGQGFFSDGTWDSNAGNWSS